MNLLSSAATAAAATFLFILPKIIIAKVEVAEVIQIGDAIEMIVESNEVMRHGNDRRDRRELRQDIRQDRRELRQDSRQDRRVGRRGRRSMCSTTTTRKNKTSSSSWWSSSSRSSSFSSSSRSRRCRPISRTVVCKKVDPPYSICPQTFGQLLVLNNYLTDAQGVTACCEMGFYPAGINSLNFVNASSLAYSCSGPGTGTWISSWNQDTYPGTCLAFNTAWTQGGGSINPAKSCNDAKKVMCQLQPAPEQPLICNGIPTVTTSSTCTTSTRTRTCSTRTSSRTRTHSASNIYSTSTLKATTFASVTVTVSTSVYNTEYLKFSTQTAVTYISHTTTISTPVSYTVTSTLTPTSSI